MAPIILTHHHRPAPPPASFPAFPCLCSAYGFLSDVVASSESYRFLGPFRYDLVGAAKLLARCGGRCSAIAMAASIGRHTAAVVPPCLLVCLRPISLACSLLFLHAAVLAILPESGGWKAKWGGL